MVSSILTSDFFDQPARVLAIDLLGKVLRHRSRSTGGKSMWLAARIIETEAYELTDKASHSSLGYTEKRAALFMAPGTIYMYYARGRDSLNFSAQGQGNAVLIKSAYPHFDDLSPPDTLAFMQMLNPGSRGPRPVDKLCGGQTLLCRSLGLKVTDWDGRTTDPGHFRLEDDGYQPGQIIQCARLGIPIGRDHTLANRFIDFDYADHCTSNPLRKRLWKINHDYFLITDRVPANPRRT